MYTYILVTSNVECSYIFVVHYYISQLMALVLDFPPYICKTNLLKVKLEGLVQLEPS